MKMQQQAQNTAINLKYVSLVTLTLQNSLVGLSMRYARTRPGDMFISSTAVLMAELVKLVICLFMVFFETGNFSNFVMTLHKTIVKEPIDTLKICVPSLLYIFQNNLLYVSASNLAAATYQVTYQLKILTTAMFAVIILRRQLLRTQWISLVVLLLGIVLVQLANSTESGPGNLARKQNAVIGFSAALTATILSGFAGIYFEKMLKGADISIWIRNVQLSLLSIPFGFLTCQVSNGAEIRKLGFLHGYDWFIWYLIVLQACGGLLVAMVVKYADNILKGFATSLAIILSCIASIYLFNFTLTFQFAFGAFLVICSIFLYGYVPKRPETAIKIEYVKRRNEARNRNRHS